MVKIVKDLYITEIKISNISNAPFVIDAIGSYSNRFTINEEIFPATDDGTSTLDLSLSKVTIVSFFLIVSHSLSP